jgi:hypothetical protein
MNFLMDEKVGYIRWPKETSFFTLPGITTSILPISPTEHFYMMERKMVVYGQTDLLRCTVDTSKVEPGKKIIPELDVTKKGRRNLRTSMWEIRNFHPMLDHDASELSMMDFKKEKIELVMDAYMAEKEALRENGKEHQEYVKNHPNLPSHYTWSPKTNPFLYHEKFCKVCDKVFIPYIRKMSN